jgi:AcrR family transcriptional regulator
MSEQRENILAAACELYLKEGLEGFSMRKLARRVGVTAPALYRHYESREGVLVDVIHHAYRRLAHHLYRALEGRTPQERFRMAGQGYVDFALENPRLYDVLYVAPDHLGWEELPEEVRTQACAVGQFWNDRVRECVAQGMLRDGDPTDISVTLWAHSHGLISLYLRGMLLVEEATFRELFRSSTWRLLVGLATSEFALQRGAEGGENADLKAGAA